MLYICLCLVTTMLWMSGKIYEGHTTLPWWASYHQDTGGHHHHSDSTLAQVDVLISHTLRATWLSDWPEIKPENCLLKIYLISLIVKTARVPTNTSDSSSLIWGLPPLKILSSAFSPTSERDLRCYEYFTILGRDTKLGGKWPAN